MMTKTNLKRTIKTDRDAIRFILDLFFNGEDYHPEDDAHDVIWYTFKPTKTERDQLNNLMNQIYQNTNVDPCNVLCFLFKNKEYIYNLAINHLNFKI